MSPKVYIIIVNWNGWQDTIECLESVFHNSYSNYQVIVCDNASEDMSLDKIKEWADGELTSNISTDETIAKNVYPYIKKPIEYVVYDREKAESGDLLNQRNESPLILIQTGENLGFAGGNNVGIRYALSRDDFEYIWLLNNDTVIDKNALKYIVNRMKEKASAGLCGSTLLYYSDPTIVQACGGLYNKWTGTTRHFHAHIPYSADCEMGNIEERISYIVGASMLVSKNFICDIGLMCEEYFLYFEELDWAIRGKEKYVLAYAPKSIVYHKEGKSTGLGDLKQQENNFSLYYILRNRVLVTKKYFPYAYITVIGYLYLVLIKSLMKLNYKRAYTIFRVICESILKRTCTY
ncbi:nucleotide-diphospho-sugar transferases [Lucifera butyrica]|uniref:Nucleotide-diphospho-sugar transferases n=1 Tax=Lucifera butyrica TaxID=1351585 RepID=A0A498RCP3_9FIRM|nr:glycosyltransferase family 2 protein [Lucifera butyrica]VBB09314.1 nucleotide-diphospho-sugar transferases [Lucifera butyrica]